MRDPRVYWIRFVDYVHSRVFRHWPASDCLKIADHPWWRFDPEWTELQAALKDYDSQISKMLHDLLTEVAATQDDGGYRN